MTKKDIILMLIIMSIYAIISFINLGSLNNPQTFWISQHNIDNAIFKLEDEDKVAYIRYYTGNYTGKYNILISNDNMVYEKIKEFEPEDVYHWYDIEISTIARKDYKYIKIQSTNANTYIGELGFFDAKGNQLSSVPINENAQKLADEQEVIPEEITYLNSTYFDEIYFARTAYEHLHGLPVYEWTHPPLGKLIMAIPIAIFGMTPFAYRLLGNIAGILMVGAIYILAKMLFKKTKYGVIAAIIMAIDGMHFVQTRIGTVDTFLVLFIMLEYIFMYKYILEKGKPIRKRLWLLFWSGLFMGMSISIKWSGAFSAIGLAAIFFINLIIEIKENKKWTKENTTTILCCIVFFIVIPILIYVLSYIPFYTEENAYITDVKSFFNWQKEMYNYHHTLDDIHTYSSKWYTWPITQKSVFYWLGSEKDGNISKIALLGNPIIFWVSVPSMIFVLIMGIKKRKINYLMLISAIICSMLPYLKIDRVMFLYHYFPTLPFAMLSIVAFMKWLCEKIKSDIPIYIFLGIALIVFIKFYPIYSGLPVPNEYLENLKWLKTWIW